MKVKDIVITGISMFVTYSSDFSALDFKLRFYHSYRPRPY